MSALDVAHINSFENSFVTGKRGGIQRIRDTGHTSRSAPARANRQTKSIFTPAKIQKLKINTRAVMLAQSAFGSPEQQKAGHGAVFADRLKALTPTGKIKRGLERLKGTGRTPVVLVSWGAFNPIHLNHIRMFQCARSMLETQTSFGVVGGFICPAHDKFVRSKCRSNVEQAIPARHRARMCEAMVHSSSWIDVDRWEVTRDTGFLDYPCVLEHVRDFLAGSLSNQHIHVMYVSGIDDLVKCAEETLITFGCVCVSRFDQRNAIKTAMRIAKRYPNRVFIAEDDEIVHHQLATLSATQVRRRIMQGKDVSVLVGPRVGAYMQKHNIWGKLRTKSWQKSDRRVKTLLRSMSQEKIARENAKASKRGAARVATERRRRTPKFDDASEPGDALKTLREKLALEQHFVGSEHLSETTGISLYSSKSNC